MHTHPVTDPFSAGRLTVGGGHDVYWAQYGQPDGPALLWLHGGPGSGTSANQVRQFDPAMWRIVVMDQRGCGASLAVDDCVSNTTSDLIADIDAVRQHLGVHTWLVCGGSWGATLALAYASRHRPHVQGLLLRNVFLASSREIHALFTAPALRPSGAYADTTDGAAWERFVDALGPGARTLTVSDRLSRAHACLSGPDVASAETLACAWAAREAVWSGDTAVGNTLAVTGTAAAAQWLRRYRIHAHYLVHGAFLDMTDILTDLSCHPPPVALIHGEADRLCPVDNTLRVRDSLPNSRCVIVDHAGHSPHDPGMSSAWQAALDIFATTGRFDGWGQP